VLYSDIGKNSKSHTVLLNDSITEGDASLVRVRMVSLEHHVSMWLVQSAVK